MISNAGEDSATLVIGPDLRVREESRGWRRSGLRNLGRATGRGIYEMFPDSRLHACLLDVFASGASVENVIFKVTGDRPRFVCASIYPLPAQERKPREVLLRVREITGQLVIDEELGVVIDANEAAAAVLGRPVTEVVGQCVWALEPFSDPQQRASVLESLERRGSHYLGRFAHQSAGGEMVELEGALLSVEE